MSTRNGVIRSTGPASEKASAGTPATGEDVDTRETVALTCPTSPTKSLPQKDSDVNGLDTSGKALDGGSTAEGEKKDQCHVEEKNAAGETAVHADDEGPGTTTVSMQSPATNGTGEPNENRQVPESPCDEKAKADEQNPANEETGDGDSDDGGSSDSGSSSSTDSDDEQAQPNGDEDHQEGVDEEETEEIQPEPKRAKTEAAAKKTAKSKATPKGKAKAKAKTKSDTKKAKDRKTKAKDEKEKEKASSAKSKAKEAPGKSKKKKTLPQLCLVQHFSICLIFQWAVGHEVRLFSESLLFFSLCVMCVCPGNVFRTPDANTNKNGKRSVQEASNSSSVKRRGAANGTMSITEAMQRGTTTAPSK